MPPSAIPFEHSIHGDSIGLDCAACHAGARSDARAFMPSKKDCMDCHRFPLTESDGIEKLDSMLAKAPDKPWARKSGLPEHVVFHHGVHAAAGLTCTDCHNPKSNYRVENISMQFCLQCHRGETFKDRNLKPAATYCAACHR